MTGHSLSAEDQGPVAPAGYRTVQVNVGGKRLPVLIKDSGDPFKNLSSSSAPAGKYDPSRIFSAKSAMSDKTYASSPGSGWNKSAELKSDVGFATKSYRFNAAAPTAPDLDNKARFTDSAFKTSSSTAFDKNFATTTANAGQDQTATLGKADSADQNRSANLGNHTPNAFASAFGDKTFRGSEADALHRGLSQLDKGQMLVTDLPNRSLTVDEVRNLINHGFKPNTHAKPPEPSKALNDPDYQPEPLRIEPSASAPRARPVLDDEKNDPLPGPGAMSPAPESTEPLPQP